MFQFQSPPEYSRQASHEAMTQAARRPEMGEPFADYTYLISASDSSYISSTVLFYPRTSTRIVPVLPKQEIRTFIGVNDQPSTVVRMTGMTHGKNVANAQERRTVQLINTAVYSIGKGKADGVQSGNRQCSAVNIIFARWYFQAESGECYRGNSGDCKALTEIDQKTATYLQSVGSAALKHTPVLKTVLSETFPRSFATGRTVVECRFGHQSTVNTMHDLQQVANIIVRVKLMS